MAHHCHQLSDISMTPITNASPQLLLEKKGGRKGGREEGREGGTKGKEGERERRKGIGQALGIEYRMKCGIR